MFYVKAAAPLAFVSAGITFIPSTSCWQVGCKYMDLKLLFVSRVCHLESTIFRGVGAGGGGGARVHLPPPPHLLNRGYRPRSFYMILCYLFDTGSMCS